MVALLLLACAGAPEGPSLGTPDTAGGEDTADSVAAPPVDLDGDGAFAYEDCDDADPTRFPGAPDACDAVDQDCDGNPVGEGACGELFVLDEGAAAGWWVGE
ncbi:MAG: putative metal-binding motif-containing protein, partial [Myxococcota bacterium]